MKSNSDPLACEEKGERSIIHLGGGRSIQLSYEGLLTCTNLLERLPTRIERKKRVNLCVLRRRMLYPLSYRGVHGMAEQTLL